MIHFRTTLLTRLLLSACIVSALAHAQVAVVLAPVPQLQFFNQSGTPLAFGCVFTYETNSTTPLATYTDYTGVTQNPNPVVLSAGGSANIWLESGSAYTFKVASAGGSNCSSGQTLYTVNGIGGGSSYLTTVVPYSATPTFMVSAQVELFTMTLTGNASANPLTFVGVTSPSIIFFQITQDSSGGHTFSWPSNSVGGCTIGSGANVTTTVEFVYNGTNATALPCSIGNGTSVTVGTLTATTAIIDNGTLTVAGLSLLNGGFGCTEGSAPSGIASTDLFWCSSVNHRFNMINDNGASDTVVGAATTDTFTNKTIDSAGTGNAIKVNGTALTATTGSGSTVALAANPTLVGWNCGVTAKTTAYTLTAADCIIQVTLSTAGFTITIPHAIVGNYWEITRTDSVAHTLTIAGDSGNVNGQASITVAAQSSLLCHADGTNSWCQTSPGPTAPLVQATTLTSSNTTFTYPIAYSATPSCFCTGYGGSCNVSTVSTTACVLSALTVSTNSVLVVGLP